MYQPNKEKGMARIYEVKKARASKKRRVCHTCGHVVTPGEAYRYFEPYTGPPVIYCADHHPTRAHMTNSKLSAIYEVADAFDPSTCEDLEELKAALETIAETAREVASEYEDSISNMPDGLQEGPVAEEMREKIDALESYADELEQFEPEEDDEEFDEEKVGINLSQELFGVDTPSNLDDEQKSEWLGLLQDAHTEWDNDHEEEQEQAFADARDQAIDLVGGLEV